MTEPMKPQAAAEPDATVAATPPAPDLGHVGRRLSSSDQRFEPTAAERRKMPRSWAQLIRRIYEVDPLVCRECGAKMRILAFILDLDKKRSLPARAPPNVSTPTA